MRKARRKRLIVRVLVFGVLGVLLSFASALPVLWVKEIPIRSLESGNATVASYTLFAKTRGVRIFATRGFMRHLDDPIIEQHWGKLRYIFDQDSGAASEIAAGVPFAFISSGFVNQLDPVSHEVHSLGWGGIESYSNRTTRYLTHKSFTNGFRFSEITVLIPTYILWRGLIGNTIFYSLIVWGVFALLGWWRRARRRRRNKCEGCAYSLEGLEDAPRCPECGRETQRGMRSEPAAAITD